MSNFSENLSLYDFKKIYPRCPNPQEWLDAMDNIFEKTSINSIKRQAAFIAQCGHESAGWSVFSENLNYSADALNRVFPKYFKNAGKDAGIYHRKPEKIANVVYANRMGNGSTATGDGWKYRGRGPIQLTGKNNYSQFDKYLVKNNLISNISITDKPDLVSRDADIALLSAVWFWEDNNLNNYCDSFNIKTLTKRINGGYNGLDDRINHYVKTLYAMIGVLKKGDRGEGVQILQELLELKADGIFGSNTEKQLITFQKKNNLESDGIMGLKTLTSLI